MMKMNPDERLTIDGILAHPWMQGDVTPHDEIMEDFANRKKIVDESAHNEREEKRKNRKDVKPAKRRAVAKGQGEEEIDESDPRELWYTLEIPEYDVHVDKTTKFFTTGNPLDYMLTLYNYFEENEINYKINGSSLQIRFETVLKEAPSEDDEEEKKEDEDDKGKETPVNCTVRIYKCNDDDGDNAAKHCVDFTYTDSENKKSIQRDERVAHHFR